MTIKEIAEITGRSYTCIWRLAKKLGRLPTIKEVQNRKNGRPLKWKI